MNEDLPERLARLPRALKLARVIEALRLERNPAISALFLRGLLRFENGGDARAAQEDLAMHVLPPWTLHNLRGQQTVPRAVEPSKGIHIGDLLESRGVYVLDQDVFTKGVLVTGAPGTGKTNIFFHIGQQLFVKEIPVTGIDHKGELRRLTNRFDRIAVFKPEQLPFNLFEPQGNPHAAYLGIIGAIARMGSLRAETWPAFPEIMLRLHRGLQNGEPHPSIRDVIAVLHHLAKQQKATLATIARTLESFAAIIGRTALVRRGPDLRGRYRAMIFEYGAAMPVRLQQCLDDLHFNRLHGAAVHEGHTTDLRDLLVIDEGMMVFHRNLNVENSSQYISPSARLVAMTRSSGRGVMVCAQNVSQIDAVLKANIATVICFRCPGVDDAWEMAKMLGLPKEAVQQITALPAGVAYVRSEGAEQAVLVRTPLVDMGPYPSDATVAERLREEFAWISANTSYAPESVRCVSPLSYQAIVGEKPADAREECEAPQPPAITEEFTTFIADLIKHPRANVTDHYRNLGWSPARGNRVRHALEEQGLIIATKVAGKTGRPAEILSISGMGKILFNA